MVALENIVTAQGDAFVWHAHISLQADDARLGIGMRNGTQGAVLRLRYHFRFIEKQKHKRLLYAAQGDGGIVAIQH